MLSENAFLAARDALRNGRFNDAAGFCEGILSQAPEHAGALAVLGTCLARMGKPGKGLGSLAKAVALEPTNADHLINACICARLAGRHAEAVDFGHRAVALERDNPRARCFLGLALIETKETEGALLQLQEAARLAPNNPQILHNFGLVLERCGREREAIEQFRKVLSIMPQAVGSRLALGELLLKYDRPSLALQEAQVCLRQDASSVSALLLAARAHVALSMPEEANGLIERVLAINPDDNAALVMKAFRAQASGNFERSNELFERALKVNPIQGSPYWGLRQGSRAKPEDLPKAAQIMEVAKKLAPGSLERSYAEFAIAKLYADVELYGEAMLYYDLANRNAAIAQRVNERYDPEAFGRFLETSKSIFTDEFAHRHAGVGDPNPKPIFIVGMMRSGTTLMEQILSSHPQVTAAGEQHFWTALAPSLIDPSTRELKTERAKSFQSGYLELLRRYGAEGRVTDKMPENARFIGLIEVLFPNASIIHMSRDMVDVGLSIYTTPYEVSPDFAHVQAHIAEACGNHLALMSFWKSVLPAGSFLDVPYSALIDDPEQAIRNVLEYCGLPWDDACLRHTENDRTILTPSVWQVRQPIYSSSRGRWKNYAPYLGDLLTLADTGGAS